MPEVREPSFLGVTIDAPDGTVRCSPHEADALDVLTDSVIRTDLHGFGPADLTLPRPEGDGGLYAADRIRRWLYSPVRVWDEADRTVYEGRIVKARPGSSVIELECEGFAAAAEDDETARLIGVDRDMAGLTGPSRTRRISLLGGARSLAEFAIDTDFETGIPALTVGMDSIATGLQGFAESKIDLGPSLTFASVGFETQQTANVASTHSGIIGAYDDDALAAGETSADLVTGTGAATSAYQTYTPASPRRIVNFQYATTTTPGVGPFGFSYRRVALFGFPVSEIPKRGTAPDEGYYVSDLAPVIVARWCPSLNVNTRSIEETSFVLPHWVQREDTTAAAMLDSLALFGGNTFLPLDWYVYDKRTLEMKSPDNHGRVWRTRLSEAAEVEDAGDDATTRIGGVKVTYTDGAGTQHTIGPPGSGSGTETTDLLDTSPTNPVNYARGVSTKIRNISMGVTFEEGATLMGQVVLADANRQKWSGDVKLKGHVREHGSGGAEEPVYMVRTFDRGIVEDDPDTSERRITATSYDTKTRTNTVTIGTPPDRFPTLAARAGVVLEPLNL